jgi:hypothetical protein
VSRYRKIDPRFWRDEKIVTLNRDEKLITLYLFTSTQSNRIGLFSFSPAGAAEDLGIALETFGKGFMEPFQKVVERLNLDWDETFRVLYLPTWWKYNCPENPNVLKACLADLHEVPQTRLIEEFSSNLKYLPATFHQTFREGLPKPSPKRMADQDQEQEQDKESASASPLPLLDSTTKKKRTGPAPNPDVRSFLTFWAETYGKRFAYAYKFTGKDGDLIKSALQTFKLDSLVALARKFFDSDDEWIRTKGGFTIGVFCSQLNKLASTDDLGKSNGHAKPEVKDVGDGFVEVDGRRMDKQTAERRGFAAT